MSAFKLFQSDPDPRLRGAVSLDKSLDDGFEPENLLNLDSSDEVNKLTPNDEYVQLQQRIFLFIMAITAFSVVITAIFFDYQTSISILIGALFGVVYMRLLAKSIGKLGKDSKTVSKVQLLIPALLVLVVSKLPQLDLLPSLLGFLLYKPSLIMQGLLESSTTAKS